VAGARFPKVRSYCLRQPPGTAGPEAGIIISFRSLHLALIIRINL